MKRLLLALTFMAGFAAWAQQPVNLRCEGMQEPLGIDNTEPHFSWQLPSTGTFKQTAYEIEVASDMDLLEDDAADIWKTGKIPSDESVMIPYGGTQLSPRSLYYWRVRCFDGQKASLWSKTQRFGVGIIAPDKMRGQFIGMGLGQEKAVLMGKSFKVKKAGATTLLHVNSLGYHEVYINGKRVGEAVLTPAVTQMNKRSLIVTYDVTNLIQKGKNSIVFWIGSGWYKEGTFNAQYKGPAVRADLDQRNGDGWIPLLQTDATWTGRESGYKDLGSWRPGQFGGERIDARFMPKKLTADNLAICKLYNIPLKPVETPVIDDIEATPQMCQLNTIKETITPVRVENLGGGQWLVDMGRVLNGFFQVHLPGMLSDNEVTAYYCDHLLDIEDFKKSGNWGQDIYIPSCLTGGDTFCNRFNHHLFRYVLLSNLPERAKLQPKDIKAYRIGMDVDVNASFCSSDNDLNQIYNMIAYTMDCLLWGGYMVDCASIERLGYGGDGNASTLTLQNTYDVAPLYMNWLQAWNDAIRPDGSVPHTAPNPYKAGGGPYWCSFIVQAPWRTWMNFGDDRLLHRCYDNMKLWLKYVDAHSKDGLLYKWPDTDYRTWYLGDWLAPKGIDVRDQQSVDLVNNCALSQSYAELIQIAKHLGQSSDQKEFEQRREALNARIHQTFYHPESQTYGSGSQLDMSYPLLVGAVPQDCEAAVTRNLVNGRDHLGVGLVGIPVLTEWATRTRQTDFMYNMLKQPDYPGYLYMIHQGATGTWEDWDNPRSHLHNCFNGIGSWFYQALGGIIPTSPGYKTVLVDPQFPQGLEWVRVSRETPYGTILVSWNQGKDGKKVHVEIPIGITANVNRQTVGPGSYDYTTE